LNIVTEYPGWWVIVCILLGVAYAAILYYRERSGDLPLSLKRMLAVFRAVTIAVIAFLLLNPLLKSVFTTTEKPVIILAQDNSRSLLIGKDSAYYRKEYPGRFRKLANQLEKDYQVRIYSFGDKVRPDVDFSFAERQTDISSLFDELLTNYSNRNVGAMLLASDGLYNKGLNPLYASAAIKFPVYTLALGDTAVQKDIFIRKVNFNRMAYLGNSFPVEVKIGAHLCGGMKSVLTVTDGQGTVFSQNLSIPDDNFSQTIRIRLDAKKEGLQRYRIRIAALENEISTANNVQDIFIDVLDSKQKVLMLSLSPHPDIAAIREAIESNFNYQVDYFPVNKFTGQVGEYNLLILHQLPGKGKMAANVIAAAKKNKIPVLYILGSQSDFTAFNRQEAGIRIMAEENSFNEAVPVLNEDFALFTIDDKIRNAADNFPPLIAPFGEYKVLTSANALFYQKIQSLVTNYPLVLFSQTLNEKSGVIAGEGIWRWRLEDYLKTGNHDAFNELITKMVQFLSVKVNKSFFRITGENNFMENQPVEFDAEVYNQSYEPVNEPEVEMKITNSQGKNFDYVFSKTADAYHLNAGVLPVDNYTYKAKVRVGDMLYTVSGEFTVSPLNIELVNTIADHTLLYQLAVKHDGKMLQLQEMDAFPEILKKREDIKTITYTEKRYKDLVNIPWVLLLILGLLATEWFVRKYNGSY
jgi:hypothetical protein